MDSAALVPATTVYESDTWFRIWAGYVVLGCAGAGAMAFILNGRFPGHPLAATAALAAIPLWAAVFGRSFFYKRTLNTRSVLFVAGVAALFVAAVCLAKSAVAALPVVYPLVFMALPMHAAVLVSVVVSAAPMGVALTIAHSHSPDLEVGLAISTIGLVLGPAIGVALTLLADHNEEQKLLLDELARSRAEVSRLSREAGIAGERARLAREIHDTLAQGFTSIVALTQVVESELTTDPVEAERHLRLIGATARENLVEARAIVAELTPSALSAGSLVESIRREGNRLHEATGVQVQVTAPQQLPPLGTAAEVVLLRAAQEAFANVRRHARAQSVTVQLDRLDDGVRLAVTDDGLGFDPDDAAPGFGLRGMRARATQIGATMHVSSKPGEGTTVALEVQA